MTTASGQKKIVVLNRDLFFGVRLRQLGTELGYIVELVPETGAFLDRLHQPEAVLGLIDIAINPEWELIARDRTAHEAPPIVAFGPHKDVDGLRSAKAAGVSRVVSNGTFHRDAAAIIERYASGSSESHSSDVDDQASIDA